MKQSSVSITPPPMLFSMGTSPRSQWPRATSSKTARMSASGRYSTDEPNFRWAARCEKLPSGPR